MKKRVFAQFRRLLEPPTWSETEFSGRARGWSGFLKAPPAERVAFDSFPFFFVFEGKLGL